MKLTDGEVVKLDNNKEYICLATASDNGKEYLILMSNFKPLEIRFAEQMINNGQIRIRVINNQEEKMKVMGLFEAYNPENQSN